MTQAALRWGIIGPGRIADEFARALTAVEGACLHAVASRNLDRAAQFATDHGASVYYDTYQALIEDPQVDALYIATPHRFHCEQARDCIAAGKPVLCEKPLTVNAGEARELIALARDANVFLMEAVRTRYLPIYQRVRRWLDAGEIGTVTGISSSFGFAFEPEPDDRLLNHDLAGGALLDLGIYNLTMSQWVLDEAPQSYSIKSVLGPTRVDEHDEVTLTYAGGRTSTFTISLTTDLDNDLVIEGTGGRITVHSMFWNATQASLIKTGEQHDAGDTVTISEAFRATGLEYEIEEAVRCIRAGLLESPGMPLNDTLDTMVLMDQLRSQMGLRYTFE